MKPELILAIDPGSSGASVLRCIETGRVVAVRNYAEDNTVRLAIGDALLTGKKVSAVIERVWASPVMGVASAFTFGENYGGWRLALKQAGIRVFGVTPQAWQKVVAPEIVGQGAARKKALKELAIVKFYLPIADPALPPGVRVTLANCDSLLLSEYALAQLRAGKPLGDEL